jgi:hypothetical protein
MVLPNNYMYMLLANACFSPFEMCLYWMKVEIGLNSIVTVTTKVFRYMQC